MWWFIRAGQRCRRPTPRSMRIPGLHTQETTFLDTPQGIFTASGIWFRTREASLYAFAADVFEREPLVTLLTKAEVWLRSPQTVALWLLPAFLLLVTPLQAALAVLVIYVAWRSLGPALVSRILTTVFRFFDLVLMQALYYALMLSWLAVQEHYVALWVGLAGFILLRWGVVRWVTQPLVTWIWGTLYKVPAPDQVLRSLILRTALQHRISLPELDAMEQEIIRNLRRPNRS